MWRARGHPSVLDFLKPGGATTGNLLPTGNVMDILDVAGIGKVEVSMWMLPTPALCVCKGWGWRGPKCLLNSTATTEMLEKIAAIRSHASVAMGIARSLEEARAKTAVPFIGFVSEAQDARTLSGGRLLATEADLTVRMISNGQPHRVLPLTCSLCTAVAACIEGTTVFQAARRVAGESLRLATPSGMLAVGAEVRREDGSWHVVHGSLLRTARRLFEGFVYA